MKTHVALVLAAVALVSVGCDRGRSASRSTMAAEVLEFQVDGMRHSGDAL